MKFILATLALVALASPLNAWKVPASGSGALAKEFNDILNLVPLNEVKNIIKDYISQDAQVQATLKIVSSPDCAALVKEVEAIREFKEIANYLQNAGVDIYLILNAVNKSLKLAPIKPLDNYKPVSGKGVAGLIQDLRNVVPVDKIMDLIKEKNKNSPVFKDLVTEVMKPKYSKIGETVVRSVHIAKLHADAEKVGVASEDFAVAFSTLFAAHVVRSQH